MLDYRCYFFKRLRTNSIFQHESLRVDSNTKFKNYHSINIFLNLTYIRRDLHGSRELF